MPWKRGVVLGEADPPAARGGRGPHRQALAPRPAPPRRPRRPDGVHVGPDDERRPLGGAPGARPARCTAAGSAPARPPTAREVAWADGAGIDLGVPVVHRAPTRTPGPCGGSAAMWIARASACGHVLRARRLVAPLDQRVGHPSGVAVGQVGLQRHQRPRLLPGRDQQRRLVGLGVEDRAHAVAQARARCAGSRARARRWPARSRRPFPPRSPPGGRARSGSRSG